MHEDILVQLKNYNNKYNRLDDAYRELQQQYDKTQFELRCIKNILLEIVQVVLPHREELVQEMLDKHDKVYKTLFEYGGSTPLASIRFNHQFSPELGAKYVWNSL
ncbi:hypothetical protein [Phthorimaea operculella granulovirus]|uniref:Uncharacterized protein n=1 Tax=Phthorimaea operculella granulovirus TaxID=192584 RepID=Q8JS25_9BBAC|nr:hypothetical protein [Phthorimaea operculella granulovirus]AAM70232.1 hypothetical protein [Phthorimaea operculella granulovirus]ANY57423.1 hypothetical protein PhopGVgp034 [Phthorimaea operculella granulovirus]QBH65869.1 hypothetical protein PhopGVgp034 [Phthorimaea operculella granulovirus]QBH65999.1 hypothetical protein PhopGVgp034 [Phthorimaea operculella granulovirus]QBH66129.1 hypothetical protein PhopGVgp034 [Phthorimaea operculella granulovirus]